MELRTLRMLRLNYNKFTTLPLVVTQLPQLHILEISGNALTVLDPMVANMTGAWIGGPRAPALRAAVHGTWEN